MMAGLLHIYLEAWVLHVQCEYQRAREENYACRVVLRDGNSSNLA